MFRGGNDGTLVDDRCVGFSRCDHGQDQFFGIDGDVDEARAGFDQRAGECVFRALRACEIDAADAGGYLVFGADSRIDPLALVQLVQRDSRRFRLQGSHRLQIRDDLTKLDKRFATIENLLEQLAVKS